MRSPQCLDDVDDDRQDSGKSKIPGHVVLLGLGLLFLVQAGVIAAQFFLHTTPPRLDRLVGSLVGCVGCWLWAWYLVRRTRRLKVAVIALVAIAVFSGLTMSGVEFFHDQRMENQARQLLAQAQEAAKPTWTEDDAIRWFVDHGIPDARRGVGAHQNASGSEQYRLVMGFRQIDEGGVFFQPTFVEIEFLFDPRDHTFRRVQYHLRSYKVETLR